MKKIKILGQAMLLLMLIVGVKVNAAEVTGNLSAGIGGSEVSGNLNGGLGNSISGTVTGGNGGGGSSSGSSSRNNNGSVLGASSGGGNGSTNPGQVLGVSTPLFPATGLGPNSESSNSNILSLIILLSLPIFAYGFYQTVKSS